MRKSLSQIKGVLIDLSGTLHISDEVIPGAVDAIRRLKESGLPVRFATNSTKESCQLLFERIAGFGFNIQPEDIFTSLIAARDFLIEKGLSKPYLVLEKEAETDFRSRLNVQSEPSGADAVVIGLGRSKFNYDSLNQVFRVLIEKKDDCQLIAIHKGRYFKQSQGLSLGPGPFVTALEYAADIKATVVGKPEKRFFQLAAEPFKCLLNEVAMIGDDGRDDVAGAVQAGMIGILVQTGKYIEGDENRIEPKPDFVFPSVVQAINEILNSKEINN